MIPVRLLISSCVRWELPDPFNSVRVADWSAASKPTRETTGETTGEATGKTKRENAIRVGCCARDTTNDVHFRTRTEAESPIRTCVNIELREGRTVPYGCFSTPALLGHTVFWACR